VPLPARQREPGDLDVRSHLQVAPGIELVISPEEAGLSMEQVRLLVREVMQAASKALGKT
jgi:hypothetical protein